MRHEAEIMTAITNRFGIGYKIQRKVTNKGNGVVLHGYAISEVGKNIGTIVYIDEYIEKIQRGLMTPEALAEIVYDISQRNKIDVDFSLDNLSKEKILGRVVPRLAKTTGNADFLENLEGRFFLDMAVIYKYQISQIDGASMNITKDLAKYFGITEEELWQASIRNGRLGDGYCIMDMVDMMKELVKFGVGGADIELDDIADQDPGMYVITNKSKMHGAAAILQDEVLRAGANICGGSYYLLPSSVHEFMMIPGSMVDDPGFLKEMVKEVNRTEVDPVDVLSNNVYRYNTIKGEIEIVF